MEGYQGGFEMGSLFAVAAGVGGWVGWVADTLCGRRRRCLVVTAAARTSNTKQHCIWKQRPWWVLRYVASLEVRRRVALTHTGEEIGVPCCLPNRCA